MDLPVADSRRLNVAPLSQGSCFHANKMTCREATHKTRKKKRRNRQRGGRADGVAIENREDTEEADEGGRQDRGMVGGGCGGSRVRSKGKSQARYNTAFIAGANQS